MKFASELQAMVVPEGGEFRLCNTICEPTSERQNALKRLVEQDQVDLILAIGGKKSSNTARLAEVGNAMGVASLPHRAAGGHRGRLAGAGDRGRHHRRRLDPGRRDRGRRRRPGRRAATPRPKAASARSTRTTCRRIRLRVVGLG